MQQARLSVLEPSLVLANIPPSAMVYCFQWVLQKALYPERSLSTSFFSITNTAGDSGLSLVIDEISLQELPIEHLFIGPTLRAIKVYEGPDAINSIGYIQALASPLAKLGINPIYLSTYGSDIILVNPDELDVALRSLEEVVGKKGMQWDEILEFSTKQTNPTPNDCAMTASILESHISVFTLSTKDIAKNAKELLSYFLFPEDLDHGQFLSYTVSDDEVSVLVNAPLADKLRNIPSIEFNSKTWSCIQIGEGSCLGQTPVHTISTLFAKRSISLYYFSTFANDYTLVPSDDIEDVISILRLELGALFDDESAN